MSQPIVRHERRLVVCATRVEEASPGRGEDRVAVVELSDGAAVVIADGAGGVAGGAEAAEAICRALVRDTSDWGAWLAQCNAGLVARGRGLAAAVVLSVCADGAVRGASVGDCEAWVFRGGEAVSLTYGQVRKPLLGDSGAVPVGFASQLSGGTLVVASDGLWKYMGHERIAEAAAMRPLESAADAMVSGVRLRSGALQDDVAIVLCEVLNT